MTDDNTEIPLFASALGVIQAEKAMRDIAKVIAVFQASLVEEGFSPSDALTLCNTWFAAAAQQSRNRR